MVFALHSQLDQLVEHIAADQSFQIPAHQHIGGRLLGVGIQFDPYGMLRIGLHAVFQIGSEGQLLSFFINLTSALSSFTVATIVIEKYYR